MLSHQPLWVPLFLSITTIFFVINITTIFNKDTTHSINSKEEFLLSTIYQDNVDDDSKNSAELSLPDDEISEKTLRKNSSSLSSSASSSVLNYYRNSEEFMKTLVSCLSSFSSTSSSNNITGCNVYYHHVHKTGGTSFEYTMLKAFPFYENDTKQSDAYSSCCEERMMKKFYLDVDHYCLAQFSSYQVYTNDMWDIVSKCMELKKRNLKATTDSSSLLLISFREPASRTLSWIHQKCNKNWDNRSPQTKQACLSCDYNKGKSFFDDMVNKTNQDYLGILKLLTLPQAIPHTKVLTFEVDDINDIFHTLRERMPYKRFPDKQRNKESLETCNFGMNSVMFKGLAPSHDVYRKLLYGS